MRNGQKPRRFGVLKAVESQTGRSGEETPELTRLTQPDDEAAALQLGFDSLDAPAEVLFRVSTEALAGEDDLIGDDCTDVVGEDGASADGAADAEETAEAEEPIEAVEAVAEPAVAEPAVAEPAVAAPAVAEPAVAEPAVAEPAVAEPAVAEPAVAEPAVAAPAVAEPAAQEAAETVEQPPIDSAVEPMDVAEPVDQPETVEPEAIEQVEVADAIKPEQVKPEAFKPGSVEPEQAFEPEQIEPEQAFEPEDVAVQVEFEDAFEPEEVAARAEPEPQPAPEVGALGSSESQGVVPSARSEVEARAEPEGSEETVGVQAVRLREDEVQAEAGVPAEVLTAELSAEPLPYEPPAAAELLIADDGSLQIRLARVHLKTGSFHMARAELESLASRSQLDTPAHLDLAEARWRTGDLHGAGEAAAVYMADGGEEALGFVIAAEAAALANRPAEARRNTELALQRHLSELDPVFAGIPCRATWSSGVWSAGVVEAPQPAPPAAVLTVPGLTEPTGPWAPASQPQSGIEAVAVAPDAPAEPDTTGLDVAGREAGVTAREESVTAREAVVTAREASVDADPEAAAALDARVQSTVEQLDAATPHGADAEGEPTAAAGARAADAVAAGSEVASGRACLDAGDPMTAALHFGVAIRLAPESAGDVLDAIGDRTDLPLQLVRGDALRLLGLEGDAGKAYLSVASALGATKTPDVEPPAAAATAEPEPPAATAEPEPPAATAEPEPPPIRWD